MSSFSFDRSVDDRTGDDGRCDLPNQTQELLHRIGRRVGNVEDVIVLHSKRASEPHWDFDLPSTIYDLPFLSEKAKHNILGGTAARLFKLPPRDEKQKENLKRFGNLAA